ncbi:MAG: DUF2268 domain-containing protein [Anaerolineae bacterium]
MNSIWINTHERYHEIIAAPTMEEKTALYKQNFLHPWKNMMDMLVPTMGGDATDELAGARMWNWLLPEDLTTTPENLRLMEQGGAWTLGEKALALAAERLTPYQDRIGFDHVEGWLVLGDPAKSEPAMGGYTGGIDWTSPRLVVQYDGPTQENIHHVQGAAVHELNHLVRLRVFPWDITQTSVADYIIHEGLAESFATALFGEDVLGYYVTRFDEAALGTARTLIEDGLEKTGFNVIRGYIFGDWFAEKWGFEKMGMPNYGGYAVGYHVVQAFLKRTGISAVEATFLPAREIINESGYFARQMA